MELLLADEASKYGGAMRGNCSVNREKVKGEVLREGEVVVIIEIGI